MIELQSVVFRRARASTDVLSDITLSIPQGQWVSIVGPNGSGKSTLLKVIGGLLRPRAGQVIINKVPLSDETLHLVRRRSGFVFQNPENQFVGQTVQDDIVFGLENQCLDRAVMEERLRRSVSSSASPNCCRAIPAPYPAGRCSELRWRQS